MSLLKSIAQATIDYRAGEIDAPTPDHVDRWVCQFPDDVQLPLLQELDHILKQTYLSKKDATTFLGKLLENKGLAGEDPSGFWKKANFLNIQQKGNSQKELLAIFDEVLEAKYGFKTSRCGATGGDFLYLDDVMFTGFHIGDDLEAWITRDAPAHAVVHVIVLGLYKFGHWKVSNRLEKVVESSGKKIEIKYWRAATFENRKIVRGESDVLWPTGLPDDPSLTAYLESLHGEKYPFEPRPAGGKLGIFSSEESRQLLEREMLLAGVKILADWGSHSGSIRPLGFSPFGLGFGSMVVTFRNCPNTCPLALWWGDPKTDTNSPLGKWYPLFPRKTYSQYLEAEIKALWPGIFKTKDTTV